MAGVVTTEQGSLNDFLTQLPIRLRQKVLRQAVRRGARPVRTRARQLVPVGDTSHNPDSPPLKATISVKVKSYQNDQVAVALVGPRYPQGAHGHLIEGGHDVVVSVGERKGQAPLAGTARVEGKEFMAPASDQTKDLQQQAIVEHLRRAIKEFGVG